jgi:hypothetical protein
MPGRSLVGRAGGSSEMVNRSQSESELHLEILHDSLTTVLVRNT